MLQRLKSAFCRLLGIKTRPYLTPSKLPEGPIIEPLTPSTLIHRRKPVGPPNEIIRHDGMVKALGQPCGNQHLRSEPVYDKTWPDPFREQRPTRYDPAPRPVLRLVGEPPATPMEIIFAEGVIGSVSSAPNLPELNAGSDAMTYTTTPRNVLPNGLTLLQQNPDCAARLDPSAKDHGWLYRRGADGQWVTLRKLSEAELETAYDQAADMAVLQGTQVRAG